MSPTRSMDDERLRRGWRDATADDAASADGCPGDEAIWSAVAGELPPDQAEKLVLHSQDCPVCAESFRIAASMAEDATGAAQSSPGMPRGGRVFVPLAAAAVLVLVAFLVPGLIRREPTSTPGAEFRNGAAVAIESLLDESTPLPREAFLLRFSPGPEGTLYTVELTTEDLTPVHHRTGLTTAEYLVPAEALATVAPGTDLFWSVEALLPDARRIDSPAFRVTVR